MLADMKYVDLKAYVMSGKDLPRAQEIEYVVRPQAFKDITSLDTTICPVRLSHTFLMIYYDSTDRVLVDQKHNGWSGGVLSSILRQ